MITFDHRGVEGRSNDHLITEGLTVDKFKESFGAITRNRIIE